MSVDNHRPNRSTPPDAVDLAKARKILEGMPAARLDSDWLAVDQAGSVALFTANERGVIPSVADTARVSEALEALARALGIRKTTATLGAEVAAYRGFAERGQEPIFDAPCSSPGSASHESPLDGYPLMVTASDPEVRALTVDWSPREAVMRNGFGLVFPVIGRATYEELHERGLCLGCRVADDPSDPRPRSPEAVASAGVYVYAHASGSAGDPYRRVASPTVAAELADLEPIVQQLAGLVRLPKRFENDEAIDPAVYMECAK